MHFILYFKILKGRKKIKGKKKGKNEGRRGKKKRRKKKEEEKKIQLIVLRVPTNPNAVVFLA